MTWRLTDYNTSSYYRARVIDGPTFMVYPANRRITVDYLQVESYRTADGKPALSVMISGLVLRKDGTQSKQRLSSTFHLDKPQHELHMPDWLRDMVNQIESTIGPVRH